MVPATHLPAARGDELGLPPAGHGRVDRRDAVLVVAAGLRPDLPVRIPGLPGRRGPDEREAPGAVARRVHDLRRVPGRPGARRRPREGDPAGPGGAPRGVEAGPDLVRGRMGRLLDARARRGRLRRDDADVLPAGPANRCDHPHELVPERAALGAVQRYRSAIVRRVLVLIDANPPTRRPDGPVWGWRRARHAR